MAATVSSNGNSAPAATRQQQHHQAADADAPKSKPKGFQRLVSILTCQALCRSAPNDEYDHFAWVEDSVHVLMHRKRKGQKTSGGKAEGGKPKAPEAAAPTAENPAAPQPTGAAT